MIDSIKKNKFKMILFIVSFAFYGITAVVTGTNILIALANALTIAAILLFAEHVVQSVFMFLLVELCSLGSMIAVTGIGHTYEYVTAELVILVLGTLIIAILEFLKVNKLDKNGSLKSKLSHIIKSEKRPKKLKIVHKIIIYSLLLSASTAIANGLSTSNGFDLTMLSSIWLIIPTFFTLATVLMVSDMYILRFINQLILGVIIYMQFSLGQPQYVNLASTLITTIALIVGYSEFCVKQKKLKLEKLKQQEEDKKNKEEAIASIDKVEPVEAEKLEVQPVEAETIEVENLEVVEDIQETDKEDVAKENENKE